MLDGKGWRVLTERIHDAGTVDEDVNVVPFVGDGFDGFVDRVF
jgi:hypothetical protein